MPQSNYPGVPQLLSLHSRARELQLLEFTCLEPMLSNEKALRQQQRPRTAKTKQILKKKKKRLKGSSLVVQWIRFQVPNAGIPGLILDKGTVNRFHMPQLKILHATTKTQHCQINK